jgi:hypothetical protein
VIARAEGARQFVLLSIKPPTDGHAKGKRAVVRSLSAGWGEFVAIAHSFLAAITRQHQAAARQA